MLIHTLKLCVNLIYELSTEAIHHMIYIIKIMQIQENNTMDCIFKFIKVMQIQEYNKIWFYFQIHFFKQFQFSVILWYIWAGCVHVCICTYKVWLNLETKSYILFQSCADIKKKILNQSLPYFLSSHLQIYNNMYQQTYQFRPLRGQIYEESWPLLEIHMNWYDC